MCPASDDPPFHLDTLAIVGVGLIGGSIAAAARVRGVAARVIGIGRNPQRLEATRQAGLLDEVGTSAELALDADLVVVCTPVDRIVEDVRAVATEAERTMLITDAGSTKQAICKSLADLDGSTGPVFLGSHPLAGGEKQGFEHADAGLFVDRVCVLTPLPKTPPEAVSRLELFWQSLGSRMLRLTPAEHDRALAATSHLPHLLAAALAASLEEEHRGLAATGFRDTTRVAGGDPQLWVPILQHNTDSVLAALDRVERLLGELRRALEARDTPALKKLLEQAKTNRDGLG